MNMKSLLKIIHTVIIAVIVLHSCNSEVFISDFTPSVSEVQLSEKILYQKFTLNHPIGIYSLYMIWMKMATTMKSKEISMDLTEV